MKATLLLIAGNWVFADKEPDLDDPKVREEILGEAVLRDTLEERGPEGAKLFYAPDSQAPHTGWSKRLYDNGKVNTLGHGTAGKADGPFTAWYENGQKMAEGHFKGGMREGLQTAWHDNGQKMAEGPYKDGKPFFEGEPDLNDPKTLEETLGKAVVWGTLEKDELTGSYHAPDTQKPYTGWAKTLHGNRKVEMLGALKNGRPSGLWTWWDENGIKEEERRH